MPFPSEYIQNLVVSHPLNCYRAKNILMEIFAVASHCSSCVHLTLKSVIHPAPRVVLLKCKSVLVPLLFKPKGFISVKIPTVGYMALRNLVPHYLRPCFSFYPLSTLTAILPPSFSLPEVSLPQSLFTCPLPESPSPQ